MSHPPSPIDIVPAGRRQSVLDEVDAVNSSRVVKRHKSSEGISDIRNQLHDAISSILATDNELNRNYGSYYSMTERLCRYKHSEQSKLADYLFETSTRVYEDVVRPQLLAALETNTLEASKQFMILYDQWSCKSVVLSKIFLFMDRNYLWQHSVKPTIRHHFMELLVLTINPFFSTTIHKWHVRLLKCRQTEPEAAMAMSKLILAVTEVIPEAPLKTKVIESIALDYSVAIDQWLSEPGYFVRVLTAISSEIAFWKEAGYPSEFLSKLRQRLKWTFIFSRFDAVLEQCLPDLFTPSPTTQVVVSLCKHTMDEYSFNSMAVFSYKLQSYLMSKFDQVIVENKAKALIPALINSCQHWQEMTSQFSGVYELEFSFRKAFSSSINRSAAISRNVTVQLIKHCDNWFKHPQDYSTFESTVITIFNALSTKIEFVAGFRQSLAKRLLVRAGGVDGQEEALIESLAAIMGEDNSILSIRRMIADIKISKSQYSELFSDEIEIKFSALVLKQDDWKDIPVSKSKLIVPPQLRQILERFTDVYNKLDTKNNHRMLDWSNWWSHKITTEIYFESKPILMQGNMFQTALVMLLCSGEPEPNQLTFDDLISQLGTDIPTLERILVPLVEKGLVLQADNKYLWNFSYVDAGDKRILKLPLAKEKNSSISTTDETETRVAEVMANRHAIQCKCLIMRILKEKRQMNVTSLLHQCLDYFEAKGTPVVIRELKLQIEDLAAHDEIKKQGEMVEYVL